jgi:RNA polymerase II elongation factor ELL
MALSVPDTGLSLWRGDQPGNLSPDPHAKQTQIMRLNLAQNTLDELVESLRNDQKARLRLGKHQTLYYGSKSQQFHSHFEPHRSELYKASSSDRDNLYFSGVLSHSLEVQKAKEATAATDEALANLEQSLSAFERGKESKKTQLVNLKPDDRRSRSKVPLSKIDLDKERFFKNRSISGSPSLGAIRSPASLPALTPTSVPPSHNKRKIRLEALKTPFIHLLAVRPVSVKYLAQTTRSSQEDCLELAKKYGIENRIDPSKFNLKDKSYKDLDIWNFPYPSESDRTSAIENAISAFDRQRVSTSDKLWQMLNSKEERVKGICKSRLKLQTAPPPPPIKVHASEEASKEGYLTGNETDRTNGRLTPNAMATDTSSKPAAKKTAPTKAKNATLTGRVTKKAEKKPPPKPTGKFKSAEFVHDSDEDTDIPDAPSLPSPPPAAKKPAAPSSTEIKKPTEAKKAPAKPVADSKPAKPISKPSSAAQSPTVKPQITLKPQPRTIKTIPANNANGTGSKTLPGSRATKPTSPIKPSPLASSPPTNASDIDNSSQNSGQTSSSSSSPLMAQMAKQSKPKPAAATTTAKPKVPTKLNGITKPVTQQPNPLKRKALPEPMPTGRLNRNGDDIKRRRPIESMSPSGTSSGSASPPHNREHLRTQLRQKSMDFKKLYSRYRDLHNSLVNQMDPTPSDLSRLKQMHARVQRMKKEIWDEDRRLRG